MLFSIFYIFVILYFKVLMVGVLLIDGVASEDELEHQHQQQGATED